MEYKNTLNLPKTDFSMKANLTNLEPKILEHWKSIDIYARLHQLRKNNDKFILHDGPPYANGVIHIGHALNKILKDIILKYKGLRGFDVPYIAGWDCHGLPVEHQLFKELKKTKHDVDIVDFRKKAKDFALKFVELQKEDFKKLGIYSDWDNPYLTINQDYESQVMKLLGFLVDKGFIYRGRRPVNWCATCETALAEAEVEYNDKQSDSIYFLFKVVDGKNIVSEDNTYFLVWTTTPWTLVSNVAVAVHPNFDYCLADLNGKKVIMLAERKTVLDGKFGTNIDIKKIIKGKDLEGIILQHPLIDRQAKVLNADFVSSEDGSGCVHIAPGHGVEDFSLTKKYPLEIIMPVNDRGVFDSPVEFQGKNIKDANAHVLELLTSKDALIKHEKINHSYPHCWRCKNPIIFRATFQWFLNVNHDGLRKRLVDEADRVNWFPSSGKERMLGMLKERPDWCLSRQRLWGIPIPAIKCKDCGEVILDKKIIDKVSDIFKTKGSNSWFSDNLNEFLPIDFSCSKCQGKNFIKEFDILDVWFESGASFFAVLQNHSALKFPADLYLEGSDQHRGWFQVSLIPSVAKEGIAPFKNILTHGFVVDGEGRKMSKSLGNVIGPQEISKKYGAEILRLWVAYSDYSEDVKLSEGIIKQLVDIYRKIRNTIRFILGNIYDFDIEKHELKYEELLELDRFILAQTALFFKDVTQSYDEFAFYKVCQKLFSFCNLDLSSFYLDICKDRLYTCSPNSRERRSAQLALYHILSMLLKLIAPILSFTAEETNLVWVNQKARKESIFLENFDDNSINGWIDTNLIKKWEKILNLRGEVLKEIEKKREIGVIGSALEAQVNLSVNDPDFSFYSEISDTLREVFIVSKVTISKGNFAIGVEKTTGEKCLRCWNWKDNLNNNGLCKRCENALIGGN